MSYITRNLLVTTAIASLMANTDAAPKKMTRKQKEAAAAAALAAGTPAPDASVFRAPDGSVIAANDDASIIEAYKDRAQSDYNITVTIEPSELLALVRNIPGDGEETDDARSEAIADRQEELDAPDDTAATRGSNNTSPPALKAARFASEITEATDAVAEAAVIGKRTYDEAPLILAYKLCKDWGGTFDADGMPETCPAVREMPIKGTTAKNSPHGPNDRVIHKYKWSDTNGDHTGDFYRDIADDTVKGRVRIKELNSLELMKQLSSDVNAIKNNSNILEAHKAEFLAKAADGIGLVLDTHQVDAAIATIKKDRMTAAGRYAAATAFLQIVDTLTARFPRAIWMYTKDWDSKKHNIEAVARSTKPIQFHVKTAKGHLKPHAAIALSTFYSLQTKNKDGRVRFEVAAQNGGDSNAIMATFKRGKKTEQPQEKNNQSGDKTTLILNADKMEALTYAVNLTMDRDDRDARDKFMASIRAMLAKHDTVESRKRFMAFGQMMQNLDDVWSPFQLQYQEMLKTPEQIKAEEKKAAA